MKLIEALKRARVVPINAETLHVISSTETSLFETYLKAFSIERSWPRRTLASEFGQLPLALLNYFDALQQAQSLVIILDWEDLFPGSSFRSFSPLQIDKSSINKNTNQFTEIIASRFEQEFVEKIVIVLPAMATAPLGPEPRNEAHIQYRQQLRAIVKVSDLGVDHEKIIILNPQEVFSYLAQDTWMNLTGLYQSGWPYSTEATCELARITFDKLYGVHERKKIIITDLDGTLWHGVIGEVGGENINFSADENGYKHLLYQRLLNRLIVEGVLVAVCSKNDITVARSGLSRTDLVLNADNLIDVRVGWEPKSIMVERLLHEINVLPESAVFIDDSAFEIGEVQSRFPNITTVKFPDDNNDVQDFVGKVQDLFSSVQLTEEDRQRTSSYKAKKRFEEKRTSAPSVDEYLNSLGMVGCIDKVTNPLEERPLQLINKTNQFNLNGRRETQQSWQRYFENHTHVLKVRLNDQFADYGIVSALVVKENNTFFDVHHFVLSCRVFSRRLEFGIVEFLNIVAQSKKMEGIRFFYTSSDKNKPVRDFLERLCNEEFKSDESQPQVVTYAPQSIPQFPGELVSTIDW